jgi:hypothetical protein
MMKTRCSIGLFVLVLFVAGLMPVLTPSAALASSLRQNSTPTFRLATSV